MRVRVGVATRKNSSNNSNATTYRIIIILVIIGTNDDNKNDCKVPKRPPLKHSSSSMGSYAVCGQSHSVARLSKTTPH